jgi:hypothetical protein
MQYLFITVAGESFQEKREEISDYPQKEEVFA